MQIVSQSQTPAKVGYIHLAYISAQLGNRISKGELISVQACLGTALAVAVAFGALAAKLANKEARRFAIKFSVFVGLCVGLLGVWGVESVWRDHRTDGQVLEHILKTKQFWAMRQPKLAHQIEAAASTNGTAASLAANYYGLKRSDKDPEVTVRAYWFAEQAASLGAHTSWIKTNELTSRYANYLVKPFEAGVNSGKLTPAQEASAREKLVQMAQLLNEEKSVKDDAAATKDDSL